MRKVIKYSEPLEQIEEKLTNLTYKKKDPKSKLISLINPILLQTPYCDKNQNMLSVKDENRRQIFFNCLLHVESLLKETLLKNKTLFFKKDLPDEVLLDSFKSVLCNPGYDECEPDKDENYVPTPSRVELSELEETFIGNAVFILEIKGLSVSNKGIKMVIDVLKYQIKNNQLMLDAYDSGSDTDEEPEGPEESTLNVEEQKKLEEMLI